MSERPPPTIVGRIEPRLAQALSTPWPWIGTALVLLVAAVAQVGLDDRLVTALAMVVPVAFLGSFPRVATVVVLIGAMGWLAPQMQPLPVAGVLGLAIVCGVAAYRLTALESCGIGALFVVNAVSPFNGSDAGAQSYLVLVVVGASLGGGRLLRSRNAVVAERDALALAHSAAVRETVLLAERTAIARELHDIVAHHISAISIQAETARYTTPDLPPLAGERFAAIGGSARDALDEMRHLLDVMRAPTRPDGDPRPPAAPDRAPQPGLDQLPALVEHARQLGTPVTVAVRGQATALAAGTDLVAYRVIQEALTNARRHAPGA
ncbi:MAG: histidine kinase, partial [Ilumatobacteraceae bacterium]